MQIIDISRPLTADTAIWPGDSPINMKPILRRAAGASVNVGRLEIGIHTGSHVDAPWHFTDTGLTIDALDLEPYWGPCQVISIRKQSGPLDPDEFAGYDLGRAPRLLVRSEASRLDPGVFPKTFAYPSPELADTLGSLGVVLYGTDAPSVDAFDDPHLPGHHALHRNGIAILEGLDLSRAADGVYLLTALPLSIGGADGSPVRAALRPMAESSSR